MKKQHTFSYYRRIPLTLVLILLSLSSMAQDRPVIAGSWVINADLSDNTDAEVAKALRAMGQKVSGCFFGCEKDRFRGGPVEQELYDRISYDKSLSITPGEKEYLFTYDDDYKRPVYTDGRSQSVSLTRLANVEDFSFAHWEGNSLLVEARPRDGGFANETFSLVAGGTQLRVEMLIHPRAFNEPINIVRIYEKVVEIN